VDVVSEPYEIEINDQRVQKPKIIKQKLPKGWFNMWVGISMNGKHALDEEGSTNGIFCSRKCGRESSAEWINKVTLKKVVQSEKKRKKKDYHDEVMDIVHEKLKDEIDKAPF